MFSIISQTISLNCCMISKPFPDWCRSDVVVDTLLCFIPKVAQTTKIITKMEKNKIELSIKSLINCAFLVARKKPPPVSLVHFLCMTQTFPCHSPCGFPRGTFTVTTCHEEDWGYRTRGSVGRWSLAGGPCLRSLSLRKPRMKEHHCTRTHTVCTHMHTDGQDAPEAK